MAQRNLGLDWECEYVDLVLKEIEIGENDDTELKWWIADISEMLIN